MIDTNNFENRHSDVPGREIILLLSLGRRRVGLSAIVFQLNPPNFKLLVLLNIDGISERVTMFLLSNLEAVSHCLS